MFANDLFVPAATRLGLALVGGLSLILLAERRHLQDLTNRVLFIRWKTWALSAPLFGFAAMGPEWGTVIFIIALSMQGLREFAALVELPTRYRRALYLAGASSSPIALVNLTLWRAMPPILLIAATLVPLLMQDIEHGVKRLALAGLGFAYVPWLLTYMLLIKKYVEDGSRILLVLGMSVALSDICAFAAGKMFGRRPLAPTLSPSKTREGVIGNVVGAYLGFAIMGFALPRSLTTLIVWLLPAVVACGCLWGDLVESLVKRQFGAKDAGSWLPGFGGLLDRIDSLLFALPLAYTVVVLWG